MILTSFDIRDFLANRWNIFAEETEPINFVVIFEKEIARYIYEFVFYAETSLIEQADGSLILSTKVKSDKEFLKWVCSFGSTN